MKENELYKGAKEFAPMKIWEPPKGKEKKVQELIESGDYFGSIKKDGFWYQFEKTKDGTCYLFSRTISTKTGHLVEKIDWVPHIKETLNKILPKGTILIGEIYYPNKSSKDVTEVMQCLKEKALARQEENGWVSYYVHDMIYYNNEDMREITAFNRYNLLKNALKNNDNPYIELAQIECDNLSDYIQENFKNGEEGTVLKRKDSVYSDGKKPAWDTMKFKTKSTVDVIITNLIPATKLYNGKEESTWQYWETAKGEKYYGDKKSSSDIAITKPYYYDWYTAFEIAYKRYDKVYKVIGTVSSGITEDMYIAMKENPDNFLYKVVEVECMSVDKEQETLRHPRFKRLREDKLVSECDYVSIFA